MKVDLYNQKGEKTGDVVLPKDIFEVKFNADLVHQIAVSQMANARQVSAHTKDRGEVSGGGKKPWRQKGTGRARHGSIRSPLWKGGGITFGPRKERVFRRNISQKMRRKALFMMLSEKAKNNLVLVVDKMQIEGEKPKTKDVAKLFSKLPCKDSSLILAMPSYDKKLFLSSRNIERVSVDEARNLNVLQLLNHKYIVFPKDSIKTIKETFLKEKE